MTHFSLQNWEQIIPEAFIKYFRKELIQSMQSWVKQLGQFRLLLNSGLK